MGSRKAVELVENEHHIRWELRDDRRGIVWLHRHFLRGKAGCYIDHDRPFAFAEAYHRLRVHQRKLKRPDGTA